MQVQQNKYNQCKTILKTRAKPDSNRTFQTTIVNPPQTLPSNFFNFLPHFKWPFKSDPIYIPIIMRTILFLGLTLLLIDCVLADQSMRSGGQGQNRRGSGTGGQGKGPGQWMNSGGYGGQQAAGRPGFRTQGGRWGPAQGRSTAQRTGRGGRLQGGIGQYPWDLGSSGRGQQGFGPAAVGGYRSAAPGTGRAQGFGRGQYSPPRQYGGQMNWANAQVRGFGRPGRNFGGQVSAAGPGRFGGPANWRGVGGRSVLATQAYQARAVESRRGVAAPFTPRAFGSGRSGNRGFGGQKKGAVGAGKVKTPKTTPKAPAAPVKAPAALAPKTLVANATAPVASSP